MPYLSDKKVFLMRKSLCIVLCPCLVRAGAQRRGCCEMHPRRLALGCGSASQKIPSSRPWLGCKEMKGLRGTMTSRKWTHRWLMSGTDKPS